MYFQILNFGCQVNDEVWDLDRPFEGDAQLKLLKFDDHEGFYY